MQLGRLYIDNVNNDNDGNNDIKMTLIMKEITLILIMMHADKSMIACIHPLGNVYQMSQNCNKM